MMDQHCTPGRVFSNLTSVEVYPIHRGSDEALYGLRVYFRNIQKTGSPLKGIEVSSLSGGRTNVGTRYLDTSSESID